MRLKVHGTWMLAALSIALVCPTSLRAQGDDEKKAPTLHELAHNANLPKAHADFSHFLYRPAGDKVVEQPDAERLLFRRPDGQPDGYAQRRGSAIIYYDRYGKVIRVQPIDASE